MEQQELQEQLQKRNEQLLDQVKSLKSSERRYRELFQECSEPMLVADLSGAVLSANSAALRATGYDEEEVPKLRLFRLFPQEAFDRLSRHVEAVVKGAEPPPAEYKLLRKDGGSLWVDVKLKGLKEESKTVALLLIARDVSYRKQAEEALKCSKENLERVLNTLSEAVLIEGAGHVIQFVNNAGRALFGNVKGMKCFEALKGSQHLWPDCLIEEIIENRRSVYRTTHSREGRLWEITGIPMLYADGSTSVLEIVRDVTGARETDESRNAADKLSTLSRVAVEMAHEIKNPLSAITTFAQLLPEKYEDPEFREVFSRTATQAVGKMNYLMEELVNFARPIKPVLEETDVREVVEQALAEVGPQLAEKAIVVRRELPRQPLIARIDREQVKRGLKELLFNSIEAVEQKGTITVSARVCRDTAERPAGKVEIAVSDNGCGIPQENLKKVFEPFFTSSSEKFGLGLAIAQRVVEEHGGTIEAKSQPGQGATFTVKLRAD